MCTNNLKLLAEKLRNKFNPLSGEAPYFSILLRLTPDNFTRQGESAGT